MANHMNVSLKDRGDNFTYNFSSSTDKFQNTYNFQFNGTIENITDGIKNKILNPKWGKRETLNNK